MKARVLVFCLVLLVCPDLFAANAQTVVLGTTQHLHSAVLAEVRTYAVSLPVSYQWAKNSKNRDQSSGVARDPLPALSEASGWNWADVKERSSYSAEFAASKAICARVRGLEPPETDWPDAATAAKLQECDSEALYYGIGIPAAPVQARQCALLETRRADDNRWPFNGTAMLMTMYANGIGAERNLDLATSLACRIDAAPFAVHGRIEHLQKLAAEHADRHDFDYCDDISSGMAGGFCAVHAASIANDRRSDKIDALSSEWTDDQRHGLKHVLTAMETYATVSGENEVDLSGTGRVGFIKDREYQVKEDWMRLLNALQSSKFSVSSDEDFQRADADLNRVYQQIMAIKPDASGHINDGTVLQPDVRAAQRIWLRYRDAWVVFAAVKYPQVSPASLKTELTRKRTDFLRNFVPGKKVSKKVSGKILARLLQGFATGGKYGQSGQVRLTA